MKSATRITAFAAAFFAALSFVNAHGSVDRVTFDGQQFSGPIPGSGPDNSSPVREISTLEPITDPTSAAMACGPGASASTKVAQVKAGGTVAYGWRSGEKPIAWPHRWGPVMLYAYQCPDGVSADKCNPPTGKEWILIDARGFDPDAASVPGSVGWVQDRFHFNQTVSSTVPAGLPGGDYLFRHEVIALHNGGKVGGAEYYVSCTQVKVTGGKGGRAAKIGAELAALPGAYSTADPGIHVNVFDSSLNAGNYVMPGPAVFSGSGSGDGGAQNNGSSPSSTGSSGSSTASPSSTGNGASTPAPTPSKPSTCKGKNKKRSLKKRALRNRHLARAAAAAEGIALRGTPKRYENLQY